MKTLELCNIPFCKNTGECILRQAVEYPVNSKDLKNQWMSWVDDCPNAEDLHPVYLQKLNDFKQNSDSSFNS
jgi:hypothetical protein